MTLRRLDESFDDFVRASSPGLMRLAYRLTGDRYAAEDLVQGALWRVARRWGAARDNPVAYAKRTLINLAHDDVRKRVRRPQEVAPGADLAGPPPGAGVEEREVLLAALRELPPRTRVVLVLRYWEDLSVEQTAELLDVSTGTVKSTASRGLERLRTILDAQGVH